MGQQEGRGGEGRGDSRRGDSRRETAGGEGRGDSKRGGGREEESTVGRKELTLEWVCHSPICTVVQEPPHTRQDTVPSALQRRPLYMCECLKQKGHFYYAWYTVHKYLFLLAAFTCTLAGHGIN